MTAAPGKPAQVRSWRDRLLALRNILPLLGMIRKTSPALTAATVVLRLIHALWPVGELWLGKLIIDQIAHPKPGRSVWMYLAVLTVVAIAGELLARAINLFTSLLGDRFTMHISIRLMEHASQLDLVSFEDPVFYDRMERARKQTAARIGMISTLAGMCQQIITLVCLSSAIIFFAPWLLVLLVASVVPAFLGEAHFATAAYSILYRFTPERRELDYLSMLGASVQSAKEVKSFGLGSYLVERARSLFERFYAANKRLALRRAAYSSLLNLLPTAGYFGAYGLIMRQTILGALTLGDLAFLSTAFAQCRSLIEAIASGLNGVAEQALYLQDLFDFFTTKPRITSPVSAVPAPRPIRFGFEFHHVSFSYPGAACRVLNNVSFRLDRHEKIALIGENGAGKTTLVKLLARLYDPTEGTIFLDGIDLREYDIEDLRREIGIIFQDYMRYDMLASENIGLGCVDQLSDESRIAESARKSLADGVIGKLPMGFRQMLGRRFEGGVDLSSGQWQKVALARAYMRDAQVLILDEPTASLDARAEYEIFRRFADLTHGKMAVLISHRFSTVRMADKVLVLENGVIREQGTHHQLIALGGRYAELFELQAEGYR